MIALRLPGGRPAAKLGMESALGPCAFAIHSPYNASLRAGVTPDSTHSRGFLHWNLRKKC